VLHCVQELAEISPPLFVSVQAGRTSPPAMSVTAVSSNAVRPNRTRRSSREHRATRAAPRARSPKKRASGRKARRVAGAIQTMPNAGVAATRSCLVRSLRARRSTHPASMPEPPEYLPPRIGGSATDRLWSPSHATKTCPAVPMAWQIATPSSLRPVQNGSRRARTQDSVPRNGPNVSR
jgi:hypothetical protein